MRTIFWVFSILTAVICSSGDKYNNQKEINHRIHLTPYIPLSNTPTMAVIICPGGSYFWLDKKTEGHDVARWLNSQGIAAFVLEYRTAGGINYVPVIRYLFGGNMYPDMLVDLQNAISDVRINCNNYNIDPDRVGVMGFSAGGHLAMLSALYPDSISHHSSGRIKSLKPDFVAAIYPVVTMSDTRYVHKRSKRGLLGERNLHNNVLMDSLSLERHVSNDCCPVFLLNCEDDPIVDYHNSILLDSALTANHVNHLYTRYPFGGHGFGSSVIKKDDISFDWKNSFIAWLKTIF